MWQARHRGTHEVDGGPTAVNRGAGHNTMHNVKTGDILQPEANTTRNTDGDRLPKGKATVLRGNERPGGCIKKCGLSHAANRRRTHKEDTSAVSQQLLCGHKMDTRAQCRSITATKIVARKRRHACAGVPRVI